MRAPEVLREPKETAQSGETTLGDPGWGLAAYGAAS